MMFETKEELITLENLGRGAAIEYFDRELRAVLKDIADPNTKATAIREITIKIQIQPNENRSFGKVVVIPSRKLAPSMGFATEIVFGREEGRLVARELDDGQGALFGATDNVVPIKQEE